MRYIPQSFSATAHRQILKNASSKIANRISSEQREKEQWFALEF